MLGIRLVLGIEETMRGFSKAIDRIDGGDVATLGDSEMSEMRCGARLAVLCLHPPDLTYGRKDTVLVSCPGKEVRARLNTRSKRRIARVLFFFFSYFFKCRVLIREKEE